MNKLLITAVVILGAIGSYYALNEGLNRHEITECYQWQQWASEYSEFYLTEWQAQQCEHHGIAVEAPVR